MASDDRLLSDCFPRSSKYHPDWIIKNGMTGTATRSGSPSGCGGDAVETRMRILDLGCGRAISSIFLAREYSSRSGRPTSGSAPPKTRCGFATRSPRPGFADSRRCPGPAYAGDYFDAIVSVDAYPYFGTDDLFLNYLAHFVKPRVGSVSPGQV